MIEEDNEIELKFRADCVARVDFIAWAEEVSGSDCLKRKEHIISPDYYYSQDGNVIRHRIGDDYHELTVKRRTSTRSTQDRLEIDLRFAPTTSVAMVQKFLKMTGFEIEFVVFKDSYIFWIQDDRCVVELVMYDVWLEGETKRSRFVEAEVGKGSLTNPASAKIVLRKWKKLLQDKFPIGEPLNDSLYEIYSGKKYKTTTE